MTKQETFNKVALHLLKQYKPSYVPGVGCLYRGKDGLKCAVGCLISDDNYSQDLEHKSATTREVQIALKASGVDVDDSIFMLDRLQTIHDVYEPERWSHHLIETAQKYGVDASVVINFNPEAE